MISDFRFAVRQLVKYRGFTIVALVTLALGIGANTAIFSVVDAVLLRPLPYRQADRLVTVASAVDFGARGEAATALSYPDYEDVGKLAGVVSSIAAWSNDGYNLTDVAVPREVQVTRTTPGLLGVLGASPMAGRNFAANEDHAPVAIISHALWLSDFGGQPGAVGRTLSLDDKSFTIVGVMPAGFTFPDANTAVWVPVGWAFSDNPAMAGMREYRAFSTVARLAPGASLPALQSELDLLSQQVTASEGGARAAGGAGKGPVGETLSAALLRDQIVGNARQPLMILLGAVALVLLIACVNAANLLVARANAREKEFAVRRAIGAGRWRIVRQLLVESVLLALAAAGVGVVLASMGLTAIAARLPQGYTVGINGTVLAFTCVLAVATGLGFGIVPALRASGIALEQALRDSAGGTVGRSRRRARNALIVSEVALALVLLVGSALLVRSFISINAINPGFDPQGILAARIRLTPERYATVSQQRRFFDDIVQRLQSQPGVTAVTVADGLPLSEVNTFGMNPQAIRPDDHDKFLEITGINVGPAYFSTMHIPLLQGRAITADDERAGAQPVCVVSKSLAQRLWPDQNPIGRVGLGRQDGTVVVGVVGDVRTKSLERAGGPIVFTPAGQDDRAYKYDVWIVVRSAHPLREAPALRQIVRTEDPNQPIATMTSYTQIVQQRYAGLELITGLISLFAALALVLAVIGIAGVTAYAVSQRTRELGIRIALGARTVDVLELLLGETVGLVGVGLVIGLAAAFGGTRTLRSMLFGVTSTDPVTFAGAALVLGVVAVVATYLPARRAARVDPLIAMRAE